MYKTLRLRIPEKLFIKFKVVCVQKNISVPKQVGALMKMFIENMDEYNKALKALDNDELK